MNVGVFIGVDQKHFLMGASVDGRVIPNGSPITALILPQISHKSWINLP
jgi:hypothetical protein